MTQETSMATEPKFNANNHLVRLRGGDYLEVKWRLVWLREIYPNASIETEMVHFDPENKMAVFKARITISDGGMATGWGSETSDDFKDFIEKAETKAIGRACAALGFGTQFAPEIDEGLAKDGGARVVDAPISSNRPANTGYQRTQPTAQVPQPNPMQLTDKQLNFIYNTGKDAGMDKNGVKAFSKEKFGKEPEQLTKSEASRFIDMLKTPA